MKKKFMRLSQGSSIENVISGTIKYSDMHGSSRCQSVMPFVKRIEELEDAIADHKETVTGTDVKPMGIDHCLWAVLDDER